MLCSCVNNIPFFVANCLCYDANRYLDLDTFPGESYHTAYGTWQLQTVNERCYNNPGQAWANREDIACYTLRPIGRAGHGSVYDSKRGRIWVYAGYTVSFHTLFLTLIVIMMFGGM